MGSRLCTPSRPALEGKLTLAGQCAPEGSSLVNVGLRCSTRSY